MRRTELSDGSLRFTMLETIKEYAAARFEATDATERRGRWSAATPDSSPSWPRRPSRSSRASTRCGGWRSSTGRTTTCERRWTGPSAPKGDDDVRTGLRIAASVWRFWQFRRQLAESGPKVQRLLDLPGAQGHDAVRCRALRALGSIAYWQRDYEHVAAPYEEAVAIAREIGEPRLLSWSIYDASYVPLVVEAAVRRGRAMLDESLAVRRGGDSVSPGTDLDGLRLPRHLRG